jgi:hypothetical protein
MRISNSRQLFTQIWCYNLLSIIVIITTDGGSSIDNGLLYHLAFFFFFKYEVICIRWSRYLEGCSMKPKQYVHELWLLHNCSTINEILASTCFPHKALSSVVNPSCSPFVRVLLVTLPFAYRCLQLTEHGLFFFNRTF